MTRVGWPLVARAWPAPQASSSVTRPAAAGAAVPAGAAGLRPVRGPGAHHARTHHQQVRARARSSGQSAERRTVASARVTTSGSSDVPMPGSVGGRMRAVLDLDRVRDDVAVPGPDVGPDRLLVGRVRRGEGEVDAGEQRERPGAVVHRHRQPERVGERADLVRLGDPAGPGRVEHDDVGGALLRAAAGTGGA